jgi:pyruvate dehydrogenase E2 component (dihydrolipoamide acetyltransferase)
MAQIIGLPKLSPTMEEGVLVRWVKKEGERVSPGDLVAEVETDKANMDFNLEDEGVLLKLLVKEGDTVKLGAPVAILGEEGEDIAGLVKEAQSGGAAPAKGDQKAEKPEKAEGKAEAKAEAKPEPKAAKKPAQEAKPAARKEAPARDEEPEEPEESPARAKAPSKEARPKNGGGRARPAAAKPGRLLASPLAKSLAIELGVDLRQVKGSGPGGRIVERDVRGAAEGGDDEGAHVEVAAATEADEVEQPDEGEEAAGSGPTALAVVRPGAVQLHDVTDEYEDRPLTPTRRTIAQRLTQAKREMPHFRVTATIDAGPLMDFRQRLNHLLGDRGKVSVNDLLLKGAALALRRVPDCNVAFMGDSIRYYSRVHMGVAVALEQGLLTPVVRNADLKGIGVISAEVRDLVDRAKRRQIKSHEIQGATFTVSNLGMFGIDNFDAIINPPAACILAVGRIQKIPVIEGERIAIGERLSLTMSCDHRAVDGALGARYLDELRDILERPESLAL